MGLLNYFSKPAPSLLGLPSGSFTLDRGGRIVMATLPSTFPTTLVAEIGRSVLTALRDAHAAQLSLGELVIYYPALKITARELRGGAIIFLSPQNLDSPAKPN